MEWFFVFLTYCAKKERDGRMDPDKQKEQFNIAYMYALGAHAGLNPGGLNVDDDSIDMLFQGKGYKAKIRNPQIQLQLKCTSSANLGDGVLKYALKKKNYDDLRGDDVVVPRYLAVLVVPNNTNDWLIHSDEYMALYKTCYWYSLRTLPECTNTTSVTIAIPLEQRLTTTSLLKLMDAASKGEPT